MASMLEALHPYPQDRLHLRLHRARSVVLTSQELVEIRAAQRTFEGAYMRTALSQFSFALVILKIFTSEFYPIGALFACYGTAIMLVAIYRRYEGNRQFFDSVESEDESSSGEENDPATPTGLTVRGRRRTLVVKKKFRTSGNSVALLVLLSFMCYVALMVLLWKLTG
ncbi:uncharacterized protein PODANS_1_10670 [Podospora anserina S mat+]|uniref:Podospora anserina S mat+ genomic DNA chromosome 1, supercontig 2 n=5 Tax=Podospora TaxID=5144 RepID=B2AYC8_PODAN|nr:uncharacterized protein PODANS_1_10670 [Podospora anserina S mat+]KAK4659487.1 hypothetical protein QC762_110670 [Podospora pseudocomata]KAK4673299.1 hypothetical protein QC763_110670 [Podospora pseudopauciseta]KAK4681802.1 hypothetical protein QC764_110670 [Podospora pseudoanserina]VBB72532.1 Putative protein of unknown function [Podospora comata]CAP69402.1 unnamed protein product [Podospora anserina S mat+]